nr:cell surface protein [Comamonas sp.]
ALTQASVLTQALAVSSITNQYAKDAGIFAKTDWVLSMPTRRYSVAVDYNAKNALGAVAAARVYSEVPGAVGGVALGQDYFSTDNTELVNGKVCVGTQGTTFLDREETGKSGSPVFSPSKASSARLCGEASVLSFAEGLTAPSVLGASVAREDAPASALFENGWGVLNTANYPKGTAPAAQAAASIGMPILGYSVIKLTNPQASAGVSGNFGITWPHRFTKVNP